MTVLTNDCFDKTVRIEPDWVGVLAVLVEITGFSRNNGFTGTDRIDKTVKTDRKREPNLQEMSKISRNV